jgi:hypothetical protein
LYAAASIALEERARRRASENVRVMRARRSRPPKVRVRRVRANFVFACRTISVPTVVRDRAVATARCAPREPIEGRRFDRGRGETLASGSRGVSSRWGSSRARRWGA